MPDEARKWLEENTWAKTDLILPESAKDVRVAYGHIRRLLAANERLQETLDATHKVMVQRGKRAIELEAQVARLREAIENNDNKVFSASENS